MNSGTVTQGIWGGFSMTGGNANNNSVTITGGTVGSVYGGQAIIKSSDETSSSGDANSNSVTIEDGTINSIITGGYSVSGTANNNTVTIKGGTINAAIEVGRSESAETSNNTLKIEGGTINSIVYAGSAYSTSASSNYNVIEIENTPILNGASLYGYVYGGATTHSGNALNIYTKNLTAQNIGNFNNINFYLDSNISNGDTLLTLTSTDGTDVTGTDIQAVMQSGSPLTNGDTVTLLTNASGVTAAKSYTGTAAEGVSLTYPLTVYRNDAGTAILAQVGNTSEDSGGGRDSSGGGDSSGESSSGESSGGESSGGESSSGDDSNNVKNIYSTDSGTIYGGYTETGNASNNTVNLYSGTFDNIYGGYAPAGSTSGNVLNVRNKNISAQNLSNFSAMNFYIPNDAANGDTMLTLTDSTATDLSGVAIKAGVVAGNSNLAVGDTINLLTNSNGLTASGTTYGTLSEGVSLLYGVNVAQAGNSVVANITSVPTINETTKKIINDTPARDLVIIQPSNNFPGFNNGDFPEEDDNGGIIYPDLPNNGIVFNIGGGSMRTKTGNGSYVDSKTTNIDLGWERTISSGSAGSFTFAPIIDYAHSNNDTYLADGTHGTGSTKYVAGGGAFRKTWNSGFYLEGSARFGKVKSDFQSNDMDKIGGQTVSYSTDANTISGHLGIGRNWRMNKNNLLHVYATYYHAHQGSMHTTLAPYGDEYDISSANSDRFKFGYRMTTRTSKISRIYTGLAFQYEHISGVNSTYLAKNLSTNSESISGSSGMLEIGWLIKPLKNNPWEVDINATGWIGHQCGVTAFAKVQKSF